MSMAVNKAFLTQLRWLFYPGILGLAEGAYVHGGDPYILELFVPFFFIHKGKNFNYIPSFRSMACVYWFMVRVYIIFLFGCWRSRGGFFLSIFREGD